MSQQSPEQFVEQVRSKREKYIALAKREEQFAKQNPAAYKRKVAMLAYLGYGYIFVVLSILTLLLLVCGAVVFLTGKGGFIGVKLLIFIVPVIYVVARSLYVKLDPPEGFDLSRMEAPELYRAIDSIRKKLGTIPIDKVILDTDVNAYAAQYPKYGLFGPTKNYLVLGLPLLLTLKPDEARSVIAHEFGHFSGQHGKFGAWVYRLNRTWAAIQANLDRNGSSWLFQKFFDWFEPKFSATSFALRRQNEFEADAAAVQIAGKEAAAKALMRLPVVAPHVQQAFWDPLLERAKTEPKPPKNALALLPEVAKSRFNLEDVESKVQRELREATGYADTHPSLTERLTAMGIEPTEIPRLTSEVAEGAGTSAAEAFFGEKLASIVARVNETHLKGMEQWWVKYHAEIQELKKKREALEAKDTLTKDEEVELVVLVRQLESDVVAAQALDKALAKYPEDATLLATQGDLLLKQDDPAGVEVMERAVALQPELAAGAHERILEYYRRIGDAEKAAEYENKALNANILEAYAQQQAQRMSISDDFQPHELTPDQLQKLQGQLAKCPNVKEAYLVRKPIQAQGNRSIHVLLATPITTIKIQDTKQKVRQEVDANLDLEQRTMIITPEDVNPWKKRFEKVPGSLVYTRK